MTFFFSAAISGLSDGCHRLCRRSWQHLGLPVQNGQSGGFAFLIVYLILAVIVGMTVMASELALGRKTGTGVVGAYKAVSKKYNWLGWLGIIAPFLIMSFYTVLGGYCVQYMCLNFAELGFGLSSHLRHIHHRLEHLRRNAHQPVRLCAVHAAVFGVCMLIVGRRLRRY